MIIFYSGFAFFDKILQVQTVRLDNLSSESEREGSHLACPPLFVESGSHPPPFVRLRVMREEGDVPFAWKTLCKRQEKKVRKD